MARKRPTMTMEDVADFTGELVKLYPVASLNLFEDIGEIIRGEIERALNKSAASVLHGARVSGRAVETGMLTEGTWIAVGGEAGDGKNCVDCLDLHGTKMTAEQFLETKYTTACDGYCRCEFVAADAVDSAAEIEAIATSELEDEQ